MWHELKKEYTVVARVGSETVRSTLDGGVEVMDYKIQRTKDWLKSDVVFLADPDKSYPLQPTMAKTILFVSPSKKRIGDFKRVCLISLYLPPWEIEELIDCVTKVYPEELPTAHSLFNKWGGNMRLICRADQISCKQQFQEFLRTENLIELVNKVWNPEFQTSPEIDQCQWLVHLCPKKGDYRAYTTKFASPHIELQIAEKVHSLRVDWKTQSGSPALGRLYECHVRKTLLEVSGAKFLSVKAKRAGRGSRVCEDVPAVQKHEVIPSNVVIKEPKEGVLYIPVECNQLGIDFFMPPWIFQTTVQKKHQVKGIEKFCSQFPNIDKWKICFIVPSTILEEFQVPLCVEDELFEGAYKLPFDFGQPVHSMVET